MVGEEAFMPRDYMTLQIFPQGKIREHRRAMI
jgi:hypothetical protein